MNKKFMETGYEFEVTKDCELIFSTIGDITRIAALREELYESIQENGMNHFKTQNLSEVLDILVLTEQKKQLRGYRDLRKTRLEMFKLSEYQKDKLDLINKGWKEVKCTIIGDFVKSEFVKLD